MKNFKRRFLCIIIITVIHRPLFSQETSAYKKALKYILHQNAHKSMVVSDTIIHLSFLNFSEQIAKTWGENNKDVVDLLDSVDHAQENQKFVLEEFKNQKFAGKEPTQIIYFSSFYPLMVIGEILVQKKKRGLSHHVQTGFNESTQYLFIFDKKYSLKRVFKTTIAYD